MSQAIQEIAEVTIMTSARRAFDLRLFPEISENRKTSFVSAEDSTEPVKKSPPRMSADCVFKVGQYAASRVVITNALRNGGLAADLTASNREADTLV